MRLLTALLTVVAVQGQATSSWECQTLNPLSYWHSWVRHGGTCTDPDLCARPPTSWDDCGFEQGPGGNNAPGVLRLDDRLWCQLWNTVSITDTCSRWAIGYLAGVGWEGAMYGLLSAVSRTCWRNPEPGCVPHRVENICWDFSCSWRRCAIQRCPAEYQLDQSEPPSVPEQWTCDPAIFGAGDACDCHCGAWDPDCDTLTLATRGCNGTDVCLPRGDVCSPRKTSLAIRKAYFGLDQDLFAAAHTPVHGPYTDDQANQEVPSAWTCPPHYFGSDDGCDLDCGTADPDCDDMEQLDLAKRIDLANNRAKFGNDTRPIF